MRNVGENRAQNGVLDCPKSKNEEKFLSIGRLDTSRYAMEGLRVLRVSLSQYQKSSSLELYLVNPCGAEQESLIVLLADNPFAGRIASPLV
ncbi:hypothetical protein E3N88_18208 [Mikania micrantha]|uniref:Uncharacterized protein n=1 Tax=Mikania micrantha TaxID=192012 RepID=A0A5N6NTZ2_9ASTR|nr:hypothetical protein E3N88_18208 [Mikania micrantha]